jgi:hypothetical protein
MCLFGQQIGTRLYIACVWLLLLEEVWPTNPCLACGIILMFSFFARLSISTRWIMFWRDFYFFASWDKLINWLRLLIESNPDEGRALQIDICLGDYFNVFFLSYGGANRIWLINDYNCVGFRVGWILFFARWVQLISWLRLLIESNPDTWSKKKRGAHDDKSMLSWGIILMFSFCAT